MARDPRQAEPEEGWLDDEATVIFGDDLLEDAQNSVPPADKHWADDEATVIFGDDLLEDLEPVSGVAPREGRRPSAERLPTEGAPAKAPSSRSATHEGTSKPLKSSSSATSRAGQPPGSTRAGRKLDSPFRGGQVGRGAGASGPLTAVQEIPQAVRTAESSNQAGGGGTRAFALGFLAASCLAVGGHFALQHRVAAPPEPQEPIVLDGDDIKPVEEEFLEQARAGDPAAVKKLTDISPTQLTKEELMARASGEEAMARRQTQRVIGAIASKPGPSITAEDVQVFFEHVGDPLTFREALVAIADHGSSVGGDLIYQAMRRFRHKKEVREFALSVLLTQQLRRSASPALLVVLDAETLTRCEDVGSLVARAAEHGDARAVRHMAKFAQTRGCGADGSQDCFPCLRNDRALVDALRAAQARGAPTVPR